MKKIHTDLSDNTALVTGAGRGIGKEIARTVADDGAKVLVNDIDESTVQSVVETIRDDGGTAIPFTADVTDPDDISSKIHDYNESSDDTINILVNNAGILGPITPIEDLSLDQWNTVINTNLTGAFICSKAVIPSMKAQREGRIINIASVAGREGNADMVAYCVSKGGLITMTRSLAEELGEYNIKVNGVAPVLANTPMIDNYDQEQLAYVKSMIPLGRLVEPEEIAELVKYLCADAADFITGQTIAISGGRGKR